MLINLIGLGRVSSLHVTTNGIHFQSKNRPFVEVLDHLVLKTPDAASYSGQSPSLSVDTD